MASTIEYRTYTSEAELKEIMLMMSEELSEPYSIFTYRYFLNGWPELCLVAYEGSEIIGAIVNKVD
jgi:peptide alpha-N-acetyltransferase